MKGIDYSYARPNPADIKAKGYSFVCRYLSNSPGKNITKAEADSLLANGLGIILVWESTANRALDGHAAGIADAQTALNEANAVGQPNFLPIYFAVDFDATAAQQAAIDDYLRGAATVLGAAWIGVYGGYYVVKRCLDNGSAKWAWQTYAWSGGQIDPRAHIYQYLNGGDFNGQVDLNESKQTNFGVWGNITPSPTQNGGEVMLQPGEIDKVIKMGLQREPTAEELGNTDWANNATLFIDTIWNNGGADNYNNENTTKIQLSAANDQIKQLDSSNQALQKTIDDQAKQIADLEKQIASMPSGGFTKPTLTSSLKDLWTAILGILQGGK